MTARGAGRITNLSDTASNVLAYSFDTAGRVTQVATTLCLPKTSSGRIAAVTVMQTT